MVWFQCEDCGDNLKKPKLPGHFRTCSAYKLSCIDCGQIFGRDTVQDHTQCITEAEKYGPKGQGKALNAATAKPNKDNKQRPEVDINVGLSERPPWFCSLCNTKATSKQALLLHADGKKHRAKARGFLASQQQPVKTDANSATENTPNDDKAKDDKHEEQPNLQESSKQNNLKPVDEVPSEKKKRKFEALENGLGKKSRNETSIDTGNGEVIQSESKEDDTVAPHSNNKIKWKKLIKAALKSHPDGMLKMKKLKKVVLKALQESDTKVNETELTVALEQKINSSSRFAIENKYVRLAAKD